MERINQFDFFDLGQKLKVLRTYTGNVIAEDAFIPTWEAYTAVDQLRNGKPMEMGVSKACAESLAARLDEVLDRHFREDDLDDGGKKWKFPTDKTPAIPSWEWSRVTKSLDEFEMVFREEMREAATYRVPDRGIFNTSKLVDVADQSFPSDLLSILPQKTRDDWKAAGRCLAFNLLSASGFHVARAVEGMVEAYYQLAHDLKPDEAKATLNSWNDYAKALEAARVADKAKGPLKPSEKVIAELLQMKDDYRNPLAHPRIVLTEGDARMLFANGESLIIAMAQEIRATRSLLVPGDFKALAAAE